MQYTIICKTCGTKTQSDTLLTTHCPSCESTDTYVGALEMTREEFYEKIRQDAIEEFKESLIKEMKEEGYSVLDTDFIKSYNLPTK